MYFFHCCVVCHQDLLSNLSVREQSLLRRNLVSPNPQLSCRACRGIACYMCITTPKGKNILLFFSCEERLRDLRLFSLERIGLWGDLVAAFQYLKGAYRKDGDRLFSRACGDRTRHNGFKLKEDRFRLDTRKKFFTMKAVKHWNNLSRETADTPSPTTCKVRLDGALSNLIQLKMPLLIAGGLDYMNLKVSSNPNYSMIL